MAILTFGATARTNNAFAVKNLTSSIQNFSLLHGASIAPNAYRYFTFNYFDELLRGNNLRANNLYTMGSNPASAYYDDVAEFCKLLVNNQLQAYTATVTQAASGLVFTLGSALASTTYGDGSVAFT